jgi:hypothetical protein
MYARKLEEQKIHRQFHSYACLNCVECNAMKKIKICNYMTDQITFENIPINERLWHTSTCLYDENKYKILFEAYIIKSNYNKIISTSTSEYILEKLWIIN